MALDEKESGTDPHHKPRPYPGLVAHMPTVHTTTTTTEPCRVLDAKNTGNISHPITTGIDPTGIHRHLKKVTMETLHEGQPEERSGKGITNAGLLPLNKTHYVALHWIMNSSLQAKLAVIFMKNSIGLYKNCSTTNDFTGNIEVFDLTLMCVSGML